MSPLNSFLLAIFSLLISSLVSCEFYSTKCTLYDKYSSTSYKLDSENLMRKSKAISTCVRKYYSSRNIEFDKWKQCLFFLALPNYYEEKLLYKDIGYFGSELVYKITLRGLIDDYCSHLKKSSPLYSGSYTRDVEVFGIIEYDNEYIPFSDGSGGSGSDSSSGSSGGSRRRNSSSKNQYGTSSPKIKEFKPSNYSSDQVISTTESSSSSTGNDSRVVVGIIVLLFILIAVIGGSYGVSKAASYKAQESARFTSATDETPLAEPYLPANYSSNSFYNAEQTVSRNQDDYAPVPPSYQDACPSFEEATRPNQGFDHVSNPPNNWNDRKR